MGSEGFKKLVGTVGNTPDSPAMPILRELSDSIHNTSKHPATTLQKLMFDTMADPFRTPEEKWAWLSGDTQHVRGMVGNEYKEYELSPMSQYKAFLLSTLSLFALEPDFRSRPDVIEKVQSVWSSYAEGAEVGDQREKLPHWSGKEPDPEEVERQRERARQLLPEFLSITQRILDIVKSPSPNKTDKFAYWSRLIPELKKLEQK